MSAPIWVTPAGSLGSILNGSTFSRQLVATNAVSFSSVSGSFPTGLSLTNGGLLSGNVLVDPVSSLASRTFTFSIQALSSYPAASIRTFTISVVTTGMYVAEYTDQDRILKTNNGYSYQITSGTISSPVVWRLSSGALPPNSSLSSNGLITVNFGQNILPFTREQFINPNIVQPESASQTAWDTWLKRVFRQSKTFDYQFTVELSDTVNPVQLSYTVRLVHLQVSIGSDPNDWFVQNQATIIVDPNQWYYYAVVSDREYITWETQSDLGNMINGSISQKLVEAESNVPVTYSLRPIGQNRFPLGLQLQPDGLISGRVSFRCYADDPINCAPNDQYDFTVRAASTGSRTFIERTFRIEIDRVYARPSDNLYIRNFPPVRERLLFNSIIDDTNYFPTELLYRPSDPWYGRNRDMRFLFAAGLEIRNLATYESTVEFNHFQKKLLFGTLGNAYSLDENLNTVYEVVYLNLLDDQVGRDPITQVPKGPPDIIDMRPYIINYYVSKGQSFYLYRPNGLENMRNRVNSGIGYYNRGLLPDWMTSVQPVEGEPGLFRSPIGYLPAVVLAYVKPNASLDIMRRLQDIDFNKIRFEFDRYMLDNSLSTNYNTSTNSYLAANLTLFDTNTTQFDSGTTKFATGVESYLNPGSGDKYIKFPRSGVFT